MKMFRGDLKPDLTIDLTDGDTPVDLSTATSVRIIGMRGSELAFDRTPTSMTDGTVTMEWQTADTATTGRILVEVEVTWPGTKPQTFRPVSNAVDIAADYA